MVFILSLKLRTVDGKVQLVQCMESVESIEEDALMMRDLVRHLYKNGMEERKLRPRMLQQSNEPNILYYQQKYYYRECIKNKIFLKNGRDDPFPGFRDFEHPEPDMEVPVLAKDSAEERQREEAELKELQKALLKRVLQLEKHCTKLEARVNLLVAIIASILRLPHLAKLRETLVGQKRYCSFAGVPEKNIVRYE